MIFLLLLSLLLTILPLHAANIRQNSTSTYSGRGFITISRPSTSEPGDFLFLFLSRSDSVFPSKLDGWVLAGSCLKKDNQDGRCSTIEECGSKMKGDYCAIGRDLGTVVFYKEVQPNEPSHYYWKLKGRHPSWAILVSVEEVNALSPVRSVATISCDDKIQSQFPSVFGKPQDALILSMAYDDAALQSDFQAPTGMDFLGWISGWDETGFLYGRSLTAEGETGTKITQGNGGYHCKDALVSIVVSGKNESIIS